MSNNKKPGKLKKIIRNTVIGGIIAFILLLIFVPDDEEPETDDGNSVTSSAVTSDNSDADEIISENDNRNENLSQYFDTSIVRERIVKLKGDGTDKVTILMYVNGSDLETENEEATGDISEIIEAGTSENVNIIIQTMGTKNWSDEYGIASDHSQRYRVVDGGLELIDDSLKQLDCTKASTLSDFIKWGVERYPADRYILQFWNHGAGPVYGFGYDQWQDEDATLTIDEMRTALTDGGAYFDFIGMDCCIMSSLEVCMALYDFCDYTILSEEFESGLGWSYTGWIKALNDNSSIDTVSLARIAIDDNVRENEESYDGDSACMALIDESIVKVLYAAWTQFAYANENSLLNENYSQKINRSRRTHPKNKLQKSGWDYGFSGFFSNFDDDALLSDYYITDIMAVAQNISSEESKALSAALASGIVYSKATSDDEYMTGLSVTLPYGDNEFYGELKSVFSKCGFEESYIKWLGNFVTAEGTREFYNYQEDWGDDWTGWEDYEDDYDWGLWDLFGDDEFWGDEEEFGWDNYCYYDDNYCEEEDNYCW